jgi:hypothetical protein
MKYTLLTRFLHEGKASLLITAPINFTLLLSNANPG